jgi:hypothetical protein
VVVRGRRGSRWRCAAVLLSALALGQCTEWPVRFERVDTDQLRVLDFAYVNLSDTTARLCEAAPGDSMLLIAYLAGQPVSAIDWQVSWNVYVSPYGTDTAFDRVALPYVPVALDTAAFSDSTEIVALKFRIPDSVLAISASVSEQAAAALGLGGKAELLGLVDSFARLSPAERAADTVLGPVLAQFAPTVAQMLSAPIRIFATVNGVNHIESDVTVRYTRLLRDYPHVYVNRNPAPRFLAVYKVKGTLPPALNPGDLDRDDTTICLFSRDSMVDPALMGPNVIFRDTLLVDVGHSYYVAVDTGVFLGSDQRDTAIALFYDQIHATFGLGTPQPEIYSARWFYEPDAAEAEGVDPTDQFIINTTGKPVQAILPPLTPRITHLKLWAQVYDGFLGEWNRPSGSALVETELHFAYTQAYLDSLSGK